MRTTIRVFLAIADPKLRESIKRLLEGEFDIKVVGEATHPLELLVEVGSTEADVVVHSWPESQEMPGICTHLLTEYPGLAIIGMPPRAARMYRCRQEITVAPCAMTGLGDLLAEIRSLSDHVVNVL